MLTGSRNILTKVFDLNLLLLYYLQETRRSKQGVACCWNCILCVFVVKGYFESSSTHSAPIILLQQQQCIVQSKKFTYLYILFLARIYFEILFKIHTIRSDFVKSHQFDLDFRPPQKENYGSQRTGRVYSSISLEIFKSKYRCMKKHLRLYTIHCQLQHQFKKMNYKCLEK